MTDKPINSEEKICEHVAGHIPCDICHPPINSVSPASTKIPTQMDWLIGAIEQGQICIDYLESVKYPMPGVARSYADEAAFYAFRAFPELRELSPASTKEEK